MGGVFHLGVLEVKVGLQVCVLILMLGQLGQYGVAPKRISGHGVASSVARLSGPRAGSTLFSPVYVGGPIQVNSGGMSAIRHSASAPPFERVVLVASLDGMQAFATALLALTVAPGGADLLTVGLPSWACLSPPGA